MASFTPQQIEQLLQEFFDTVGARQYVGARYVPIFGRKGEGSIEWDNSAPYEPLTVVMHNGISYVSKQYVPKDVNILDTAYWAETYRFNAQVEQYRQEVLSFQANIDNRVPYPNPETYPKYGTDGQVLGTLGNGATRWVDPVVPSDEQAQSVIESWLDQHPEATTTVQDGAVTTPKLADGAVTRPKLATEITSHIDIVQPLTNMLANMVDPDNASIVNLSTTGGTTTFVNSATARMVVVPCMPNTHYTALQTLTSARFMLYSCIDFPVAGMAYSVGQPSNNYTSPKQITTGPNDNYLVVKFYDSGLDTQHTMEEHLSTVMVSHDTATEFEPFGSIAITSDQISDGVYDSIELSIQEHLLPFDCMLGNIFNPDETIILNLTNTSSSKFGNSTTSRIAVIPCKPNTYYSVLQNIISERFGIFSCADFPAAGVSYSAGYPSTNTSPKYITTGANDKYLAIRFYDSSLDTQHTIDEHLRSLMVSEGKLARVFEPYGIIGIDPDDLTNETYQTIGEQTRDIVEEMIGNAGTDVYGIAYNNQTGVVTRAANATGKQNDYVIGNTFAHGGTNDFDGIYPWSDMRTCNIAYDSLGDPVVTYEGETGFSRDGSNGSVYVEIPSFFTRRYQDGVNDVLLISGTQHGGFEREPAFYDSETGEPIDRIYVGAYLTETGQASLNSVSGSFPESNVSLAGFRERTGELYDYVTLLALQKLMSVEFGMMDMSPIFGGFSNLPWSSSVRANESATGANSATFKGDARIGNIGVGNTISIGSTAGAVQNRTITSVGAVTSSGGAYYREISFDGSPVDLVEGVTLLYCTGQRSGFTDSLTYHTGRTDNNSGSTLSNQFRYRGIEALWGTLGELMNGVIVKDLRMYWTPLKTNLTDITKYKRLNFGVPLQNTYSSSSNPLPPQIRKMGLDFRYPAIMFPQQLAEINAGPFTGDSFFSVLDTGPDGQQYAPGTEFVGVSSMAWDGNMNNGLYTLRFWSTADGSQSWLYGSRAIIRHFG